MMAAAEPAPGRLLVVDDDPEQALMIRTMLRGTSRPWQVEGQLTVDGLAEQLSDGRFDAWILDHHLGSMLGDQVLQLLPPAVQRPPVVVVTGSRDPRLLDTYLSLGVADFLSKDELKPATLDRTLRFAIAQWRSQRALERSQQDLLRSERLATIGRMSSGVAHEYNNLNAVVLAGLERLHALVAGDPKAHDLIQRVLGAVERSRRISESLLTLGRPTDSNATIIDVRPPLNDTVALMELRARRFGARLVLQACDQPCPVRIDLNDLHQVLSNLVVNALHAVHRAHDPTVTVRLERAQESVVLQVQDNGVGIDPEDMPRLFQPFFSRKGAHDRSGRFPSSVNGTGLGLSVCQVLIDRVGGDLKVSSQPGIGTTVSVVLPMSEPATTDVVQLPDPVTVVSSSAQARPRVVVVDDNPQLNQLLHEALAEAGFPVHAYLDPVHFLAEHPLDDIDLLVLDWQMPGLNGQQVLERLGKRPRARPLRVLVVSGEPPSVPTMPTSIKIDGVVMKPFRLGDLMDRLSAFG